jgi:hypothetical protein
MLKLKDILLGEGLEEMARSGNIFTLTQQQKDRINPDNYRGTAREVATWMKNTNGPIKNADIAAQLYPNVPAVDRGARTNQHFNKLIQVAFGNVQPQPQAAPQQPRVAQQRQPRQQRQQNNPPQQVQNVDVVAQRPDTETLVSNIRSTMEQNGASQDEIDKRIEFFNKVRG